MLMSHPRISCVLPCWNGEEYLATTLQSFLDQDYAKKELVVVDGKSTDRSHEIIRRFMKASKSIRWVQYEDAGPVDAFSRGIQEARGDIIGYLGDDDILYQGLFSTIAYHASIIDYDAIYFDSYTFRVKDRTCELRRCPQLPFTPESLLSFGTIVGFEDIYFKHHVFRDNPLPLNNRFCFDYEFYLSLMSKGYMFLYVNQVATVNRFGGNLSEAHAQQQFDEACEVARKHVKKIGYHGYVYFSQQKRTRIRNPLKGSWVA